MSKPKCIFLAPRPFARRQVVEILAPRYLIGNTEQHMILHLKRNVRGNFQRASTESRIQPDSRWTLC